MLKNLLAALRGDAKPAKLEEARAWRSRGNAALAQGALDEAEQCYRHALAADAGDSASALNLGFVLGEQGRAEEALASLGQALAGLDDEKDLQVDARFLLGRAHQALGHANHAIVQYETALAARPAFDEALGALVELQLASGQPALALASARAGAATTPSAFRTMLLARALHACGHGADALRCVEDVLEREPGHFGALDARGNLLLEQGRPDDARAAFEQAIALHGAQGEMLGNLAAALLKLDRPADALRCAEAALLDQPTSRAALHNKGQAFLNLLRVQEARDVTLHALTLYPHDADLRWNLAVAHLLLGELAPGFAAQEARWQAAGFVSGVPAEILQRPRWMGREALAGKTILLYAEQGLGDTIQFVRYVPLVAARAKEVIVRAPSALAPLLGELAPNCRVLTDGAPLPAADWQCPLLSLPLAFGTTLADVPAPVPYLRADPARVRGWQARLPQDHRTKVGIVWSGNPSHTNDRNRSFALAQFKTLATCDAHFVSLQAQVRESDRAAASLWPELLPFGASLGDFSDTAALIEALDLVITVDTSVAHLAGALGRPVWILLPFCPDWRWMLDRADTPWYPTARLYRQNAPGAWQPVLARVRADLEAFTPVRPAQ